MIRYEGKNQSVESNSEITHTIVVEKKWHSVSYYDRISYIQQGTGKTKQIKNKRFIVT